MQSDLQNNQLDNAIELVRRLNGNELIIAGYGSLPDRPEAGMHNLGPAFISDHVKGLHILVESCRGVPGTPGLVAGLLPSPGQNAMANLSMVSSDKIESLREKLRVRELNGKAYCPSLVHTFPLEGPPVLALAFVTAIWHPNFVSMDAKAAAQIVAKASGSCGSNLDYLKMVTDFERRAFGQTTPSLADIHAELDVATTNPVTRSAHPVLQRQF